MFLKIPKRKLIINFLGFIFRPKKNPVFQIDLTIDKDGPKFNTAYENFEGVLCSLFDKAIQATQAVPQMEKVT